jgi:hypothetical protein
MHSLKMEVRVFGVQSLLDEVLGSGTPMALPQSPPVHTAALDDRDLHQPFPSSWNLMLIQHNRRGAGAWSGRAGIL